MKLAFDPGILLIKRQIEETSLSEPTGNNKVSRKPKKKFYRNSKKTGESFSVIAIRKAASREGLSTTRFIEKLLRLDKELTARKSRLLEKSATAARSETRDRFGQLHDMIRRLEAYEVEQVGFAISEEDDSRAREEFRAAFPVVVETDEAMGFVDDGTTVESVNVELAREVESFLLMLAETIDKRVQFPQYELKNVDDEIKISPSVAEVAEEIGSLRSALVEDFRTGFSNEVVRRGLSVLGSKLLYSLGRIDVYLGGMMRLEEMRKSRLADEENLTNILTVEFSDANKRLKNLHERVSSLLSDPVSRTK